MLFLIISILSSVSVGILFKLIKINFSESFLVITINYITAALLTYLCFDIEIKNNSINYYFVIPLVILMPTVFYLLKTSILKSGIIKTDIAQRISLIIPITASFLFFGEKISYLKWIGIFLGFISVILMLYKKDQNLNKNYFTLFFVFLGYGIIDIIFKNIALQKENPFIIYLFYVFIGSFLVSLAISLFTKQKSKFEIKIYMFGFVLGVLNFLNIYFYLQAHKVFNNNPSTVFAVMNFGVISLATILGVFLFKEKLSKKNIFGIVMSFLAIMFILVSQYKMN